MALGEYVHAEGQERPGLGEREGLAHTRRVAEDQVALQEAEVLLGNADLRQISEAGVDAVGRRIAGGDAIDQGARGDEPLPGGGGESHLGATRGDALQLLEGEGISIE